MTKQNKNSSRAEGSGVSSGSPIKLGVGNNELGIPPVVVAISFTITVLLATQFYLVKTEEPEPSSETLQTYRNEEFGFEFRYPVGWEVDEKENAERIFFAPTFERT